MPRLRPLGDNPVLFRRATSCGIYRLVGIALQEEPSPSRRSATEVRLGVQSSLMTDVGEQGQWRRTSTLPEVVASARTWFSATPGNEFRSYSGSSASLTGAGGAWRVSGLAWVVRPPDGVWICSRRLRGSIVRRVGQPWRRLFREVHLRISEWRDLVETSPLRAFACEEGVGGDFQPLNTTSSEKKLSGSVPGFRRL